MNTIIACNLIFDSFGILILLLLLIPAYARKNSGDKSDRRGRFFIYAMAVHYNVLFINLIGTISILLANAGQVKAVCEALSLILIAFSVMIIAVGIFCDEKGRGKGYALPLSADKDLLAIHDIDTRSSEGRHLHTLQGVDAFLDGFGVGGHFDDGIWLIIRSDK